MSAACGSLHRAAPVRDGTDGRDRERIRRADRAGRVAKARTRRRRAGAGRCRGAGRTSRGWSGSRSATVTSAVMPVAARSPVATWAARSSRAIPRRRQAGATPTARISSGPDPSGRCESAAPTTVVPVTAIVAWRPRRSPAATSRCASDASAGAMTPGARVRPAQVPASTDTTIDVSPVGAVGRIGGRRPCRLGKRIPPAAVPRDAEQARHDETADERRGLGRMRLGGRLRRVEQHPGVRRVDEPLGERRLPVPGRLRRPSIAPRGRGGVRDLAMRARQPDQRPRPWHDAIGVVPAATGRQPPAAGVTGAPPRRRAGPPRPSRSSSPAGARADPRRANRRRAGRRSGPARTRRPARGAATGRPPATRPRRSRAGTAR